MSVKNITTENEIALAFRDPRIHNFLSKQQTRILSKRSWRSSQESNMCNYFVYHVNEHTKNYQTTGQLGTSFSYFSTLNVTTNNTRLVYMCIVLHIYSFSAASSWWDTGMLLVSMRLPFSQKEWKGSEHNWPSHTSQHTLLAAFLLGCNCNSHLSDSEFLFEAPIQTWVARHSKD